MKTIKKRMLSYVLTVLMLVSLMPTNAFATESTDTIDGEMSDEFKAILNEDGKFVMNSVKPTSEEEAYFFFHETEYMLEKYEGFRFSSFNEDFTSCVIEYGYDWSTGETQESHKIDIIYKYDDDIKDLAAGLVEKLPEWKYDEETGFSHPYYFMITDTEMMNWWRNCNPNIFSEVLMLKYSGEFRELMGHKNFEFAQFDPRAGFDGPFLTSAMGFAIFEYDGVVYDTADVAFKAQHVIYVPEDTGDTAEELMAAAQKRFDDYLGEGVATVLNYNKGILESLLVDYDVRIAEYEKEVANRKESVNTILADISELANKISEYETLINDNNTKIETNTFTIDDANNCVTNLENQINEYDTLLSNCYTYTDEYNNQLALYRSDIEMYKNEIATLEVLVEETEDEGMIAMYQADIENYQSLIAEYTTNVENIESELAVYETQVSEYLALKEACLEEVNEYNTKITQLQSDNDQYNMENTSYYEQMNTLSIEKMNRESEMNVEQFNLEQAESNLNWQKEYKQYTIDDYNNEEGEYYFLNEAAGDYWFTVEIEGANDNAEGEYTIQFVFVVVKDNDKMLTPKHITSDVRTDVSVESVDSSIPLDTTVSVDKLTSGPKYEEIMDVLKVDENLTFDISLYSNTLEANVEKLDSGKFDVKIPLDATFEGKDLVVYYVDDAKEVHEYEVSVVDGYAKFTTDHFSVYTLAVKEAEPEPEPEPDESTIKVTEGEADIPQDLVKDAITEAGMSDVVILPMEEVSKEVTSVRIPVLSLKEVATAEKALKLDTSKALVTIDSKALDKIVKDAGENANITLAVDEIKKDILNVKQQDAIKDKEVKQVISAEIICNNKNITEFGGGKVTVQIPFKLDDGAKGSDYKVIYVADDGKTEDIATTYKDGCIVVELEHFSEYVIVKDTANNTGIAGGAVTGDMSNAWMWFGVLAATAIVLATMNISKKWEQEE